MKFCGMQGVLLLVACLLIVSEATTRRKACPYRQDCRARVRLSAAAVCRQFAYTESSCRSCHCQAPSSLYCRQLCAFREQITKCAREFLCPPPTAATTMASTEVTSLLTTSTAITTTTPMSKSFLRFFVVVINIPPI